MQAGAGLKCSFSAQRNCMCTIGAMQAGRCHGRPRFHTPTVTHHSYAYVLPGAMVSESHGQSGLVRTFAYVIHTNKQQILGSFDPQNYPPSPCLWKQGTSCC